LTRLPARLESIPAHDQVTLLFPELPELYHQAHE
jgi:hypothetical protein